MKYIQDMFHVTWLSALQHGSGFCVSIEEQVSKAFTKCLWFTYAHLCINTKKILKWAVISTSVSTIPCLNSMLQGFSEGYNSKGYFTFKFLQQLREEFQFESHRLLYCSAEVSDQEANRSTARIFYVYLATYLLNWPKWEGLTNIHVT